MSEGITRQHARRMGRRHGELDALEGRSGPSCRAESIVGADSASAFVMAWREGYSSIMSPLLAEGTLVSIPGDAPGHRAYVRTTGSSRIVHGVISIECQGTAGPATWVPVPLIKREG